ncbi:MAG: cytidylate kinase-like family protein [Muribaculaceae bacterium]|jgi:cytidylate kinase|nr:cytidylate kinase-like family protein [Muribaculaceae bacterium]
MENISKPNTVITIGRQFGSGGRELGRKLADAFGFRYFDKELLSEAAKRAGMSPEFFERNDERAPSFINGIFSFSFGLAPSNIYAGSTAISDDSLYRAQSDFIHSLADEGSCVIVGRSADYVLRDHPRTINLFVHAPIEDRIQRILRRQPELSKEKAKAKAEKINRLRANYYNFYTDKTWGAAESYDLTFNTALMSMDDITEVVRDYMNRRFRD